MGQTLVIDAIREACVNEEFVAGGNYRNIFGAGFVGYKLNYIRSRVFVK